ncbi:MAG: outer membrane beta-barrel protein [Bacteroidales bacterium]|nr:outer membrane beta-barrel protein [Bacteroidales bacterium]
MRKSLFFVLAMVIATSMSAQFYAGFNVGYAMGAQKDNLGSSFNDNFTKETALYGSFGQGVIINGKLGMMFNDNFGFELGLNYLMGSAQTMIETSNASQKAKSSGLRLAPQLVFKLESGLYSRAGLFIPVLGKTVMTTEDSDYYDDGTNIAMSMEAESKGKFSLGFVGAVGYVC